LRQYLVHAQTHPSIEIVDYPDKADVLHVESAYSIPETSLEKPIVYVCHGGFVPDPLLVVEKNLERASVVVSVADWIVKEFFSPDVARKTTIIPNGVNLAEFDNLVCGAIDGIPDLRDKVYVLYGKEGSYFMDDFYYLMDYCGQRNTDVSFVSLINNSQVMPHWKFVVAGLQPKMNMNCIIKSASVLMMTGSEVCPTMLLEAWACKVPVLARNIHGNAELMTRNGCSPMPIGGILYDGVETLPYHLERLLEIGHELGETGRCEVETSYQWRDIIDRYFAVYERLV
jgi:glycosyltransferase involved in cell wall biosynthesis